MSSSSMQLDLPSSLSIPRNHVASLEAVLKDAGFVIGRWNVTPLSGGTSNELFKLERSDGSNSEVTAVVIKLFGAWTKIRSDPLVGASVNRVASTLGIAPRVYSAGSDGICQESLQGVVLEKSDFSRPTAQLLHSITSILATLHRAQIPIELRHVERKDAVLLSQFRNMLRYMKSMPSKPLPNGVVASEIEDAYLHLEDTLLSLDLPLELCHADMKPANIISLACAGEQDGTTRLSLVDFDLSGPSFRGYDLYKPFSCLEDAVARQEFLSLYVHARDSCESLEALQHEVLLFEPVALLERTIVHCINHMVEPSPGMESKAQTDWRNFRAERHKLNEHRTALVNLARKGASE
eukprot:TRINITY_DN1835_c1_g3_i1.p1 TRINITY_DN1835_c1_g3~~TRINITY_DN1835_c1_g3_i1.p1  ORF type:complete len:351 (+),score=26.20 TRINITY_DN1835_c1_g3_i1:31-1083(+)